MTGEPISANLMTSIRQLSDWFQAVPVQKVQLAIGAVMIAWMMYAAAQLVGVWVSEPSADPLPLVSHNPAAPGEADAPPDLNALQAMQLFGEGGAAAAEVETVPAATEQEAIEAEKTQLNLVLEGIVYSSTPEQSAAVIVHQGKQETYRVGEDIPGGNQVKLVQVLLDRVILNNGGKYEALWLYDDSKRDQSAPSRPAPRPAVASKVNDLRGDESVTEMARDYRERVFNNPTSLAEVIRITPAKRDGAMIGYRLSPGKDRAQFETLGLKSGDVVTSINDIDLNEPSNALEVYKLMRTATEASFTVDRNGQTLQINVALSGQ